MRTHSLVGLVAAIILAGILAASAQEKTPKDRWEGWTWLLGEWKADGTNATFTLAPELDRKVLVRKHHAEIPASEGRPASVHDDLMVVYRDPSTGTQKAMYWDNEDHKIGYDVAINTDTKTIQLVSAGGPGPKFRLTYVSTGADSVKISFEMAPPGSTEFKPYLEGTASRVKPTK